MNYDENEVKGLSDDELAQETVLVPYEVEVRDYTAAELDDAIAWTEIEVAELAEYELAQKLGRTHDLECLTENLKTLKAEKNRREV